MNPLRVEKVSRVATMLSDRRYQQKKGKNRRDREEQKLKRELQALRTESRRVWLA